tara:strand:+ start:3911 stop:5125 length:1215 start_codon:yes stop_codon:yes gene_type:complete
MKKIINKLTNEPLLFLTIPICFPLVLIFLLFYPIIKVRFGLINSDRIGHFAANTELYLCRKNDKEKIFLDLFYFPTIPCNRQLEIMIKRELNIFPKFVIRPFDLIIRSFKFLKFLNAIKTSHGDHDIYNYVDTSKNYIKFNDNEKKKGKNFLKKINLYKAKYICLTIRDEKYVETNWINKKTMDYHKHRNMEIDDFIPACKYLNKRGYYVIRMGSDPKKKMSYKNSKFIDYACSEYKSDFLDIYLLSNCYFNISSVMGLDAIPFIFRKPILYLSAIPIGHFPTSSKKFIVSTMKHYDTKVKKYLSISEIFKKGCGFLYSKNDYKKKNIKLIPYDKKEIKEYVREMLKFVNNNYKVTKEDKILNELFWNNYINNIKLFSIFKLLHGKIKSIYSTCNLRKNKQLLK